MSCPKFFKWLDCKDPDSNIPYSFTWEPWITSENTSLVDNAVNNNITVTLADLEEIDVAPLVLGAVIVDVDNSIIYFWLSGGTAGLKYNITCEVITANGITEIQTGVLTCSEK